MEREDNPVLVKLPRTPGRKDAEYMHLFCGPIDVQRHATQAQTATDSESPGRVGVPELAERVTRLEAEVAELKEQMKASR
jgi:hypothetical protein